MFSVCLIIYKIERIELYGDSVFNFWMSHLFYKVTTPFFTPAISMVVQFLYMSVSYF